MAIRYLFLWMSLLLSSSCKSQLAPAETGKILAHVPVSTDTSLSYALYIPASITDISTSPCLLFFDPSGSGQFPLELYKNLAEDYRVVLIGNNNSKNGMDLNIILTNLQPLLNELETKHHISKAQITFWGFSGGAKAAMYTADLHPDIQKVIYGGAFYPMKTARKKLGFAGTQDMNYSDLMAYNLEQRNSDDHFQLEYDGKHSWPDTSIAVLAFAWLKLDQEEKNSAFVSATADVWKLEYEQRLSQHQYYRARNMLEKAIFMLSDKTDLSFFQQQLNEMTEGKIPGYKTEMTLRNATQQQEQQLKSYYGQKFFTENTARWKNEIDKLNASADPMHQRIVAYFSLAAYSLSNNALRNNDLVAAEQILSIYQLADPANSEQAFLRAVLYARQKNIPKSKTALEEAKKLGFSDWKRVQENPYLKGVISY